MAFDYFGSQVMAVLVKKLLCFLESGRALASDRDLVILVSKEVLVVAAAPVGPGF